jgi:hypothetical protein
MHFETSQSTGSVNHIVAEAPDAELIKFQGYLSKLGGFFNRSWQKRYVYLLADRLSWCHEQLVSTCSLIVVYLLMPHPPLQQPLKHSIMFTDIIGVHEVVNRKQKCIVVSTPTKGYNFRAAVCLCFCCTEHFSWVLSIAFAERL